MAMIMMAHFASKSYNGNYKREIIPFFGTPPFSLGSSSKTFPSYGSFGSRVLSMLSYSSGYSSSETSSQTGSWERFGYSKIGLSSIVPNENEVPFGDGFESTLKNKNIVFGYPMKINIPKELKYSSSQFSETLEGNNVQVNLLEKTSNIVTTNEIPNYLTLSTSEIELSEEYTRVTHHGPNPRVIHTYGDQILENHPTREIEPAIESVTELDKVNPNLPKDSTSTYRFLQSCYFCNKELELGLKDVYIYREASFCSPECRFYEIMDEEAKKNNDDNKLFGGAASARNREVVFFVGDQPVAGKI